MTAAQKTAATAKQMPLKKLTEKQRSDLQHDLYETIGKVEAREAKEKQRRDDWNKATGKMRAEISQIAKKLREDDVAPAKSSG